jgi:hypothetical protein
MSHVTIEIRKAPFVSEAERKRAFKEEVRNYPRDEILQIRGKGNAPVPERYQQAIADFLNSREWDRVGDLDNAGIVEVDGKYVPTSIFLKRIEPLRQAFNSTKVAQTIYR